MSYDPLLVALGLTALASAASPARFAPTVARAAVGINAGALPTLKTSGDLAIDSGDGNKLKWWNGSAWQTAGGSTSPGGGGMEVQFNNSGAFGGSADLTWDGSNLSARALVLMPASLPPFPVIGNVAIDGSDAYKLKWYDGVVWHDAGGGSGGTPGGADTEVQFNSSGTFGGSSSLTWNGARLETSGFVITSAALPGSPATGQLAIDSGDADKLKWWDGSAWNIAGGGGGSIGGSATATEVAYGSGVNTLTSNAGLTFDGFNLYSGGTMTADAGVTTTQLNLFATTLPPFPTYNTLVVDSADSNILKWWDGTTWMSAGGSGNPAGLDTEVQFNNTGSFGADSAFTWTSTTKSLANITYDVEDGISLNIIRTLASTYSSGGGEFNCIRATVGNSMSAVNSTLMRCAEFAADDYNTSNSGHAAELYGVDCRTSSTHDHASAAAIDTVHGLRNLVTVGRTGAGTYTATSVYGDQTSVAIDGAVVTNVYGIRLSVTATVASTVTNLYGIKQEGAAARNVFDGSVSSPSGPVAQRNEGFGSLTLRAVTTGADNTAVGYSVLAVATTGNFNTGVGAYALSVCTGGENTAIGNQALLSNTSSSGNTAVGHTALRSNTTNSNNTAVGRGAAYSATADNNTAVGQTALFATTTGSRNTAIGSLAVQNGNTADTTAVGFEAALNVTTNEHVAIGSRALRACNTGLRHTAVGFEAMRLSTTASDCTAIGYKALTANVSGSSNTVVGYQAMVVSASGGNNTAVGNDALGGQNGAAGNTALGSQAGVTATSGNFNTFLGYAADTNLGTGTYRTAVGAQASCLNDSTIRMGRASTDTLRGFNYTADSDRRLKENIVDLSLGLDFLMSLRPVSYKWKDRTFGEIRRDGVVVSESQRITYSRNHCGFIAQEIGDALKATGKDFGLYQDSGVANGITEELAVDLDNYHDPADLKGYSVEQMLAVAVKAIQELKAEVNSLRAA